MDGEAYERAATLILQGVDISLAISLAQVDASPMLRRFVAPSIGIGAIPDPRCVADRLKGKDPLTRADVLQALAACAR